MHKRGLCRHVVSVSVCLSVMFVDCVKTNRNIFDFFSPPGSHTILVFPYQTGWRYSNGNLPNGSIECRWGRQKRDSGRISGFAVYRSTVLSTVRVAKCEKQPRRTAASVEHSPRRPSSVVRTRRRRSVCDGLAVIRRRRMEVNPPNTTPWS